MRPDQMKSESENPDDSLVSSVTPKPRPEYDPDCPDPLKDLDSLASNIRQTVAAQDTRAGEVAVEREDTLRTAGQRAINLTWERTHAAIAILVTVFALSACVYLIYIGKGHEGAFQLLGNVFFMVISTYFTRTNHIRTGGVGKNEVGR